jgi:hypothetical protein
LFWLSAAGFVLLAAGLTALAWPIATGVTSEPKSRLLAVERQFQLAVDAGAERFAAAEFATARSALEQSRAAMQRQAERLLPFRDFRPVRASLEAASVAAIAAQQAAAQGSGRAGAEAAIELAQTAVSRAALGAETVPLPELRAPLQIARFQLSEAEKHLERDEHDAARRAADIALIEANAVADQALAAASRYTDEQRVQTWRSWVNETIEWSRRHRAPAIVVYKEQHLLQLYINGQLAASYLADLGTNVLERKLSAGDQATPEGRYRIVRRLDQGESRYYKALLLDYPNEADRQRLEEQQERGAVSAAARPGGLIEIHGEGGRGTNWTDGCVALANADMDDLFARVPVDTPVTIVGGNGRDGIFSNLVRELDRQ